MDSHSPSRNSRTRISRGRIPVIASPVVTAAIPITCAPCKRALPRAARATLGPRPPRARKPACPPLTWPAAAWPLTACPPHVPIPAMASTGIHRRRNCQKSCQHQRSKHRMKKLLHLTTSFLLISLKEAVLAPSSPNVNLEAVLHVNLGAVLRGATAIFLRFPVGATYSGTCGLAQLIPGQARSGSWARRQPYG